MSRLGLIVVFGLVAFHRPTALQAGQPLTAAPAIWQSDAGSAGVSGLAASHYRYGGYHRYGPYYRYGNYSSAYYHSHYAFGAPRYYGYAYSYRPYYYRPMQFYYRPSYYYPGYSYAAASTYYQPYYAYGYPSAFGPTGYGVYTYAPGTYAYGYPPISSYYVGSSPFGYYQPGYAVSVGVGGPAYFGWGYPSYRYYSYGGFGTPFAMSYGFYGW